MIEIITTVPTFAITQTTTTQSIMISDRDRLAVSNRRKQTKKNNSSTHTTLSLYEVDSSRIQTPSYFKHKTSSKRLIFVVCDNKNILPTILTYLLTAARTHE